MNPPQGLEAPAEARLDDRIARLGRGRRNAAARGELRDHVVQSATDLAGDGPVLTRHVDAAFDGLGSDHDIRAAFFPTPPRAPLHPAAMAVLAGAALLVVAGALAATGGTASCSVEGSGSCKATATGDVPDVVLFASPPLLALAALVWLPAWTGLAVAAPYLAVGLLRLSALTDEAAPHGAWVEDAAIVAAAALTLAVAARQVWLERRLAHA